MTHTLSTNENGNLTINSTEISAKTLEMCGVDYEKDKNGTTRITIDSNGNKCRINESSTFFKDICSDLLETEQSPAMA